MSALFELAARNKFRFPSIRGPITTEDLWELPLTAKSGFSLDVVAKTVHAELKALTEESFVTVRPTPGKAEAEAKLEIVKHVIATCIAENEAARTASARKEQKAKLLGILAEKQDGKFREMSAEEIQAQIDALG